MLTPENARDVLLKKHPGYFINRYVDWENWYIMSLEDKSGRQLDDASFSINKETGKVKEFSPLLLVDPDEFFENAKAVKF